MLAVSPGTVQPSTYTPRHNGRAPKTPSAQTDQPASTPRPISSSNPGVAGFDQRTRQWLWSPEPGHPIYCPRPTHPSSPGPAGPGAARVLIVVVPASGVHHPSCAAPRNDRREPGRAGPSAPSVLHGGRGPCTARQSCPVLRSAAPKARLLPRPSASTVSWSSVALFRWEPDGTPPPLSPVLATAAICGVRRVAVAVPAPESSRRLPGAAVGAPHARRPAPWLPARLAPGNH